MCQRNESLSHAHCLLEIRQTRLTRWDVLHCLTDSLSSQVSASTPLKGEAASGRSQQFELLPPSVQEASVHQHHSHLEQKARTHSQLLTSVELDCKVPGNQSPLGLAISHQLKHCLPLSFLLKLIDTWLCFLLSFSKKRRLK